MKSVRRPSQKAPFFLNFLCSRFFSPFWFKRVYYFNCFNGSDMLYAQKQVLFVSPSANQCLSSWGHVVRKWGMESMVRVCVPYVGWGAELLISETEAIDARVYFTSFLGHVSTQWLAFNMLQVCRHSVIPYGSKMSQRRSLSVSCQTMSDFLHGQEVIVPEVTVDPHLAFVFEVIKERFLRRYLG